jgi:hypothetical protein
MDRDWSSDVCSSDLLLVSALLVSALLVSALLVSALLVSALLVSALLVSALLVSNFKQSKLNLGTVYKTFSLFFLQDLFGGIPGNEGFKFCNFSIFNTQINFYIVFYDIVDINFFDKVIKKKMK